MNKPRFYYGYAFDGDVSEAKQKLYAKQRKERGFDDTEVWNLDEAIVRWVFPRLNVYRAQCLDIKSHPADMTFEEWLQTVNRMILGFKEYLEEGKFMLKLHREKDDNKKEAMWSNRNKIIQEGFELFGKHLGALWT